jgi:diadenosine tetraphosphate (Ap4A) HIT family hydrolase
MPESEEKELFAVAQKLGKQLKEKLNAKHIFLLVMGTDVPHTHVHLIPSYEGAELDAIKLGDNVETDLDAVLAEIKEEN